MPNMPLTLPIRTLFLREKKVLSLYENNPFLEENNLNYLQTKQDNELEVDFLFDELASYMFEDVEEQDNSNNFFFDSLTNNSLYIYVNQNKKNQINLLKNKYSIHRTVFNNIKNKEELLLLKKTHMDILTNNLSFEKSFNFVKLIHTFIEDPEKDLLNLKEFASDLIYNDEEESYYEFLLRRSEDALSKYPEMFFINGTNLLDVKSILKENGFCYFNAITSNNFFFYLDSDDSEKKNIQKNTWST